ncbi:DUF3784 domain-containing protein [Neobacillus thermocopriae]|uniref:DUF3784 domain-containing protein n=1 Tax=Neobacillus thermocopriae TaxID=1215031 RepID=UPI00376F9C79
MDTKVVVLGVIFLVLAYLVGVKKQTYWLSGFNQHRVKDKQKLGTIVGSYNFVVAVVLIISGWVRILPLEILMLPIVIGYLLLIVYVHVKMVE